MSTKEWNTYRSLHDALADHGFTSKKENDDQRRSVYDSNGVKVGSFTAAEAWDWLARQ
jgi:hypothetical protein